MIIKNKNVFHLQGKNISYIMAVNECGDLLHYYYGKKLRDKNYEWIKQKWSVWNGYGPDKWTLDICPQEYPAYGYTDLRTPAYDGDILYFVPEIVIVPELNEVISPVTSPSNI